MDQITSGDRAALKCLPAGWFTINSLSPFAIRRPKWRVRRLFALGLLEKEPNVATGTQYRKVKQ